MHNNLPKCNDNNQKLKERPNAIKICAPLISKSTQTQVPECKATSAQTEKLCINNNQSNEIISNVNMRSPNLPIILINFHKTINLPFLVDTGSSISIIDKTQFDIIKQVIKCKILSRQVEISTVNSKVNFYSCVEIAFKIQKLYVKHTFFTIDIADTKNFAGILGMDILQKLSAKIFPSDNFCVLKDTAILFVNDKSKESNQCITSVNIETQETYDAHLCNRVSIEPFEQV